MPAKVPFHVVHSSGQDDNYRASELNRHTPMTKGWQSNRFCIYPQDIVIQLEKRTRVRKIQILSHQYLIPTKIEIYVGDAPSGNNNASLHQARYTRLGYVALSNNEKTSFKARELKSVHVDAVGSFVKLIIHKNHINAHNIYNQVGLIAINVIGEEVSQEVIPKKEEDNSAYAKDFISPLDDLAFDMYQDPEVASVIRKLEKQKQNAVLEERYDLAKKLKGVIQELQKVGEKLGRYDVEKRQAVENEDYDKAKLKKLQADEYRLQAYKDLELTEFLEVQGSTRHLQTIEIESRIPTPPRLSELPVRATPVIDPSPRNYVPVSAGRSYAPASARQPYAPASAVERSYAPPILSYDDRPLPTIKNRQQQQQEIENQYPRDVEESDEPKASQPVEEEEISGAPDETGAPGASEPDQLNERDMRDAAVLIEEFGMPVATKAYAKQWSFRDEAINEVLTALKELTSANQKEEVRNKLKAAVALLSRVLKDQVLGVFMNGLTLLKYLLTEFSATHKLARQDLAYVVEKTLFILLQRTGDTALRIRDAAKNFILEEARFPDVKPTHLVTTECVKPFKLIIAPRLALSRTELVEFLYNEHGLDNSGLTVENMMGFCTQALQYTGGEVREKAEQIIISLYRVVGAPVRDYLPHDGDKRSKMLLYKQLFDAFDKIDGRTPRDPKRPNQDADLAKQKEIAELLNKQQELKEHMIDSQNNNNYNAAIDDVRQSKDTPRNRNKTINKKKDQPTEESPAAPTDKSCIFCGEVNEAFDDKGLDVHYWKSCPMLLRCEHCNQVVEIATFSEHVLTECTKRDQFQKCPRCTEAIAKTDFKTHTADKSSAHVAAEPGKSHCPLCHLNIPDGEESWKIHLMGKDGCKHNPRRLAALNKASRGGQAAGMNKANAGSKLPQKTKPTPR